MKKIICLISALLLLFTSFSSFAESSENPFDVENLNETQLLALLEALKEPLASYGYSLEYNKDEKEEGRLENAAEYPTDYGVAVSKCTWEMNEGFYSPVIKVEVRNNTGKASKNINLQVVFYDDDKAEVWDDQSTYLISSSDTPLKNGFSKTGMLRSTWGYKKYVESGSLPNLSYEVYINGTVYFDGAVEKPGNSSEIQAAISAAKKLKSILKNPSSIQVHAAFIEKEASNPSIVLEISAQNGFGGVNRKYYKCKMSGTSCISCSEDEYFELFDNYNYKELDVSLIAPSVEE